MPITNEVLVKYSVTTGSAGNTVAGTAPGSLGKFISTTAITSATLQNIFATLTGDENASSSVDYACFFIHNSHATLTYLAPKIWVTNKTAAATVVAIGLDPTAATAFGTTSAQAVLVANKLTAPAGVSFSLPATKSVGLSLGDLLPNQVRAVWLRRTAANTGALATDSFRVNIEGDSAF